MSEVLFDRQRDPGVQRASILSRALWSIGYLIYIFVASMMDGALPSPVLWITYLLQYGAALILSGLLILAIRRMHVWPKHLRWGGTTLLVPLLTLALTLVDNGSLIFLAEHGHPEMRSWAHWSLVWGLRTAFLYFWVFCVNTALVLLAFTIEQVRVSERAC